MPSRITGIAGEIKALIDGMSEATGYNYNWSNINEPDSAQKKSWPSAVIRYNKEAAADGAIENIYGFQNAEFTIEVEQKIVAAATTKPEFTADSALDNCLADLRKVFRANDTTGYLPLSKEAIITFVSSEKVKNSRSDIYKPVKLITTWNVFYHNA